MKRILACFSALSLTLSSFTARAASVPSPIQDFRNIFYSLALPEYQEADIRRLIYAPDARYLEAPDNASPEAYAERQANWKAVKPSELFAAGEAQPFEEIKGLEARMREHPVTIIIIPGIFGEFIEHSPFHEVFTLEQSAFAESWRKSLEAQPLDDEVFDFETQAQVKKPLAELTVAASLDATDGAPLVRMLYLKPLLGSLETLGTLEDSASVTLRRLDKILPLLAGQDVYLLGYSRGLNVVHQVLADASSGEARSWLPQVKGVISLGGTLYGSALADSAVQDGTPTNKLIKRLQTLSEELQIPEGDTPILAQASLLASNTEAWAKAALDLAAINAERPTHEGLEIEEIASDTPNISSLARILNQIIFEKFQLTQADQYANNVKKFKHLMQEVWEGINTLTAEGSQNWIKTHQLPAGLRYMVVLGTMPNPSSVEGGKGELVGDSVSFNTSALDYRFLRSSYYDYLDFSGFAVNDSQISPDRGIYWPAYHQSLNPAQPAFQTELLAILGTDHWGMSFPVAFESTDQQINPFPRTTLAMSLGAYLSTR